MLIASSGRHRAANAGLAVALPMMTCAFGWGVGPPPAQATASSSATAASLVNGSGSSYVALAMEEWTTTAKVRGIKVNYNGNLGSPAGVGQYRQKQVDFAGTEAEVKSLTGGDASMTRGYQYVPDVAGAVAVMYNLKDAAGRRVNWLHLDQRTISRIFTGDITHWSDPAITATNGGKRLPNEPIKVVYRTGQSGTTALFYDFVREAARDVYERWRRRLNLADHRIVELPAAPRPFAPNIIGKTTSDAMAAYVGSNNGLWSIGYDEFGYAKKHDVQVAHVKNGAGKWWQPYAEHIAEALKDATLRPDLSQELSGVYRSRRPKAYPISAYSYMMVQCGASGDRATCRGRYGDKGVETSLANFMRLVACDGQVKMSRIGYSPLPPNLSQEIAKAVGRMTGRTPERLTRSNCANPTFYGSLGEGATSPPDPFASLPGGVAGTTGGQGDGSGGPGATASAGTGSNAGGAGAGTGGSGAGRGAKPVGFNGSMPGAGALPVLALLATIVIPPSVMAVRRRLGG